MSNYSFKSLYLPVFPVIAVLFINQTPTCCFILYSFVSAFWVFWKCLNLIPLDLSLPKPKKWNLAAFDLQHTNLSSFEAETRLTCSWFLLLWTALLTISERLSQFQNLDQGILQSETILYTEHCQDVIYVACKHQVIQFCIFCLVNKECVRIFDLISGVRLSSKDWQLWNAWVSIWGVCLQDLEMRLIRKTDTSPNCSRCLIWNRGAVKSPS